MIELFQEYKVPIFAILGGALPAMFWLWFWLRQEDHQQPEPKGLIIMSFILGGILVLIAMWLERYSLNFVTDNKIQIIVWATIEELLKFAGVMIIISGNSFVDEPIDYPIYFITVALGFAAFENFSYLLQENLGGKIIGLITGNLRFLGSTLLHSISSGIIGSAMALSFYTKTYRGIYTTAGIILAITLHSVFNFFIMKGSGENFLSVFGFLWVVAIINILVFEKIKRMKNYIPITQ